MEDDIFAAVLPMVGSEGAIWALSTPWGARGWFYDLHEGDGAQVNGWERHLVDVHASDQYDERRINETRATVSRFVWASDYLCEFEDADAQLFSSTDVRAAVAAGSAVTPLFTTTHDPDEHEGDPAWSNDQNLWMALGGVTCKWRTSRARSEAHASSDQGRRSSAGSGRYAHAQGSPGARRVQRRRDHRWRVAAR